MPRGEEPLRAMDDVSLCVLVRDRDADQEEAWQAYSELFRRHFDRVAAQAQRWVRDQHLAEEVASEAFLSTFRALRAGAGPNENFVAYVRSAVRAESIRVAEARRRMEPIAPSELEEQLALIDDGFEESVGERAQILQALAGLPEHWQRILWILEVDGKSLEAVTAEFNLESGAARALAMRAREGLRTAYLQVHAEVAAEHCRPFVEMLGKYVRGGLRPRKLARIKEHLANCPGCMREVEKLLQLNERLREAVGRVFQRTANVA